MVGATLWSFGLGARILRHHGGPWFCCGDHCHILGRLRYTHSQSLPEDGCSTRF